MYRTISMSFGYFLHETLVFCIDSHTSTMFVTLFCDTFSLARVYLPVRHLQYLLLLPTFSAILIPFSFYLFFIFYYRIAAGFLAHFSLQKSPGYSQSLLSPLFLDGQQMCRVRISMVNGIKSA